MDVITIEPIFECVACGHDYGHDQDSGKKPAVRCPECGEHLVNVIYRVPVCLVRPAEVLTMQITVGDAKIGEENTP